MANRLGVGGALGSVLTGLEPLVDRALRRAARTQMMCQQLGLPLEDIGKPVFEDGGNAPV
jgi:hypothetical protein